MTDKHNIDLSDLSLDEMGRVILSADLLERIQDCDSQLTAAGSNYNCGGTANGGCTNTRCNDSLNGTCTNLMTCGSSANSFNCKSPLSEFPINSGCSG